MPIKFEHICNLFHHVFPTLCFQLLNLLFDFDDILNCFRCKDSVFCGLTLSSPNL